MNLRESGICSTSHTRFTENWWIDQSFFFFFSLIWDRFQEERFENGKEEKKNKGIEEETPRRELERDIKRERGKREIGKGKEE